MTQLQREQHIRMTGRVANQRQSITPWTWVECINSWLRWRETWVNDVCVVREQERSKTKPQ